MYEDYVYPAWGEAVGWIIAATSMLFVPILIVKTIVDIYCFEKGSASSAQVGVYSHLAIKPSCHQREIDSPPTNDSEIIGTVYFHSITYL